MGLCGFRNDIIANIVLHAFQAEQKQFQLLLSSYNVQNTVINKGFNAIISYNQ